MKRRDAVKAIAIGTVAPTLLTTVRAQALAPVAPVPFTSQWQRWPDMPWVGPEYWGNRLQDWHIENGRAQCNLSDENRTLHCLTHQLSEASTPFEMQVTVDFQNRSGEENYAGFRIGAKGPFDDYRSAAVFGEGLDAGITTQGRLFIGDTQSEASLSVDQPLRLTLTATPTGSTYTLRLTAQNPSDKSSQRELEVSDVAAQTLRGNLALVSHFADQPETNQPSVSFDQWHISGKKITQHEDHTYGPVYFVQYTLHRGVLKLGAQLASVETVPGHAVSLQLKRDGQWQTVQQRSMDPMGRSVQFRLEDWKAAEAVPYRVRLTLPLRDGMQHYHYEGTIAQEPKDAQKVKLAVFSCNMDYGFPDTEVVKNVQLHQPDLAAFLGDQFYEGTGPFPIQVEPVEKAALDYLYRWTMFGWSYRDIFRHIPVACIPDDHDVYHGNVWGEGGKAAAGPEVFSEELPNGTKLAGGALTKARQDSGGYKMSPEWVNMVQRTQTGHLPDPYDPTPVKQGINVYYTHWNYGGVSFAILEDRKFKSAPQHVLPPEADVINGFSQNPDFDLREHRVPDANLLGERQLTFLRDWATDWREGAVMKAVLSQTNFCTVATLPAGTINDDMVPELVVPPPDAYVPGDAPTQDMDSNGWPQDGRDEAVRTIRKCFALHIAGDQHLASVVRYGVDAYDDASFAFAGPALNNVWPRRWWPPVGDDHQPLPDQPKYTGNFRDGFGNRMTVHAVANPRQTGREPAIIYDRVTGYGMVTFDKQERTMTLECWPRYVNPQENPQGQYNGWPVTVKQADNYARKPVAYLDQLMIEGADNAVIEVIREVDDELVYAQRMVGNRFQPPVFAEGRYTVRISEPDKNQQKTLNGLLAQADPQKSKTTQITL